MRKFLLPVALGVCLVGAAQKKGYACLVCQDYYGRRHAEAFVHYCGC